MLERLTRTFLTLLALLTFGSVLAAPAVAQRPVAILELDRPPHSPFLLRATLPIPEGVFPRADGKVPLGIVDHDPTGRVVPAQLEVVTRRPDGSAAVVEILAVVVSSDEDGERDRLRYSVVSELHDPEPALPAPQSILDLAPQAGGSGIVLRTRDIYGNEYRFDLLGGATDRGFGGVQWMKRGAHLNELRAVGALVPTGPAQPDGPPLPRMMGVHAYLRTSPAAEVLLLDLRVHNGLGSGRRDPHPHERPLGSLYWTSLELELPAGYSLHTDVADPFFGEPKTIGERVRVPIVKPPADGTLHFMPPQAQFHRRLAIAAPGARKHAEALLENHGLAFPVFREDLWSWNNPRTANYFPQHDMLASFDFYKREQQSGKGAVRAEAAVRWLDLRKRLEQGVAGDYPATGSVMGWAHPWFIPEAGGHGGEDVQFFEGHRAAAAGSRHDYGRLAFLHRMNTSRQPQAAWDRLGNPIGYPEWRLPDGSIDFDYRMYARAVPPDFKLPCQGGKYTNPQVAEVAERGLRPTYDQGEPDAKDGNFPTSADALLYWFPHDSEHLIRYTKNAKALVWLGNDSLAKDDLELTAELFRLQFHEGSTAQANNPGGPTLYNFERIAAAHPHQTLPVGRETAWGIDAMCSAYLAGDDAFRARHVAWLRRVTDLLEAGAPANGLIVRTTYGAVLNNPKYAAAHAFQNAILLVAMRSLHESCWKGVDEARAATLRRIYFDGTEALYFSHLFQRVKASWTSGGQNVYLQGPRWAFAVSLNDDYETPVFCDAERWGPNYMPDDGYNGGVETQYGFTVLSFAADWSAGPKGTGLENRYLERTLDLGEAARDWKSRFDGLVRESSIPSLDQTQNLMGYLARLQHASRAKREK